MDEHSQNIKDVIIFGFFSMIMALIFYYLIDETFQTEIEGIKIGGTIGMFICIWVFSIYLYTKINKIKTGTRVEFAENTEEYLKLVIESCKDAKKKILLLINSVKSSEGRPSIKTLQKILSEKKKKNIEIRIIASSEEQENNECDLSGRYEISSKYGVRFNPSVNLNEFKFTLIDQKTIIHSFKVEKNGNKEKQAIKFHSYGYSKILTQYFNKIWKDPKSITFQNLIFSCFDKLAHPYNGENIDYYHEKLKLSKNIITRYYDKKQKKTDLP
jgi:hypothetical protein